ncbi:TM2 domain-containing protein [Nesterenkonia sphaerica]|uniref:TM2 domain-containing protein n=1 Tax=Nesterenkonia sphaerica TaxID=1804988 RepID=A0A5R9ACQ4_9MICC|nr:TM2 domain-containing protein [Nesterenkonia sphaerica]TLP75815.1 TM2 domain-containing protein [Nesterenkonia sphaerica]
MPADYDLDELYANTYTEQDRRAFETQPESSKKFLVAWSLALFLGPIGAQRYYLGYLPTAVLKTSMFCAGVVLMILGLPNAGLPLVGVVGAWTIVDLFLLLSGTMRDRADHRLQGFTRFGGICAAATVLVLVGWLIVALVIGTSSGVAG